MSWLQKQPRSRSTASRRSIPSTTYVGRFFVVQGGSQLLGGGDRERHVRARGGGGSGGGAESHEPRESRESQCESREHITQLTNTTHRLSFFLCTTCNSKGLASCSVFILMWLARLTGQALALRNRRRYSLLGRYLAVEGPERPDQNDSRYWPCALRVLARWIATSGAARCCAISLLALRRKGGGTLPRDFVRSR